MFKKTLTRTHRKSEFVQSIHFQQDKIFFVGTTTLMTIPSQAKPSEINSYLICSAFILVLPAFLILKPSPKKRANWYMTFENEKNQVYNNAMIPKEFYSV